MTPDSLLDLFVEIAAAVRTAVAGIPAERRRDRTARSGQYALDLVADDVACGLLERAGVRIVSEETGVRGRADAPVTVVVDPVDGSTNCSRDIPYWAISLCALDGDGALCGLVVNQATGVRTTATRGGGAYRDGERLHASRVTRIEEAMVYLTGRPAVFHPWKQWRALGSAALGLSDVAAGALDGFLDAGTFHAPWDYLAGYLACIEAGAVVRDARARPIVTDDVDARRKLVAAGTPELADAIAVGNV